MKPEFDSASNDRVLAVLYGEDGASQSLSASEAADVAALGEVRSMFADALDEEPPSAISTQLLLAAAQQAPLSSKPAREAPDSWWAGITRWFEPLLRHPGLTAAASLALVATLGGVLYLKGRGKVAQPPAPAAKQTAPVSVSEHSLPPTLQSSHLEEKTSEQFNESKGLSDSASAGLVRQETRAAETSKAKSPEANASGRRLNAAEINSHPRPKKGELDRGPVRRKPAPKRRSTKKKAPSSRLRSGDSAPLGGSITDRNESPTSEPVQPQQPQAIGARSAKEPAQDVEADSVEQEASPPQSLADFRRRAAAAAEKGDCRAARALGRTVSQRDQRYYKTVFVRDRDIRRCYQK